MDILCLYLNTCFKYHTFATLVLLINFNEEGCVNTQASKFQHTKTLEFKFLFSLIR
jgi:hypothetical protein